jgi:hypothetical protein
VAKLAAARGKPEHDERSSHEDEGKNIHAR